MITAIKAAAAILVMTANHYAYESPRGFVEMVGFATNEYFCLQADPELRPHMASCAAYCAAGEWWLDDNELKEACERLD